MSGTRVFANPQVTTVERDALVLPPNGSQIYNTDTSELQTTNDNGATWQSLGSGSGTSSYGEAFFQGNATYTTIVTQGVAVKVAGTYSSGELLEFTQVSGTLTYTGATSQVLAVEASLTSTLNLADAGVSFIFYLNGAPVTKSIQSPVIDGTTPSPKSVSVSCFLSLSTNDTLELYVQNNENTDDVLIQDLNFKASSIGAIGTGGGGVGTSPAQVLYVSQDGNDGTGDGTIQKPFLTYEAARLAAVAYPATAANPFVIKLDGIFAVAGNVTISPYVSITGNGIYTSALSPTGEYNLDASWSTETNPTATLSNFNAFTGTGFNLTYTTDKAGILIFQNMFYDGDFVLTAPGLVNAVQPLFIFVNCADISGVPSNNLTANEVSVTCLGSGFNVTNINNVGVLNLVSFYALNCAAIFQLILTDSGGAGVQGILSNSICASLTLDGAATFLSCGAMSYPGAPTFANGATLAANLQFPNIADGIVTNTYTPVNFTPVADPALYNADTVQGYFEGIDDALLKAYGGASCITGFVTTIAAISTYYPVGNDGAGLVLGPTDGFTPQILNISGVNTLVLTYNDAPTRDFLYNWSISIRGAAVVELKAKFAICIYKADTSIVVTNAMSFSRVSDLVGQWTCSFGDTVNLATGDSIFLQVKTDVSATPANFYCETASANIQAVD